MKSSLLKKLLTLSILTFGLTQMSGQVTLAQWNYESTTYTAATPQPSSTAAPVIMATPTSGIVNTAGTVGGSYGAANGYAGSCAGLSGNAWLVFPFDYGTVASPNGVRFNVSSAGYRDMLVSWDQRPSDSSPNTGELQYTTDGTTWTQFPMTSANTTITCGTITAYNRYQISANQFARISVNMTALAALNNNPNFAVRIMAAPQLATGQFRRADGSGIAATNGAWRFDNVTVRGTLIPGPNPSVMSGTTSICWGQSANISVNITGGAGPFLLVYYNGSTNVTVNNYVSGAPISVSPTTTTTYTIVSVNNVNNSNFPAGTGNSGSAVITVNSPTVTASNVVGCGPGPTPLSGGLPAGGTYSIPNPYSGASTTFTYTYTDPSTGCTRTSAPANFIRTTPITITTQHSTADQSVCQGGTFPTLSVTATGTGPLLYQWYSDTNQDLVGGTPLTTSAHISAGSKTASFTPLATTVGTTYYYVVITNPYSGTCGTAKSAAASGLFTVSAPTVAGSISPAQTICSGESAATITLTGQTGTIVKWQRADDNLFTTNVQDIANTTTTLTGAEIGPVTQTTYIRVVVKSGACAQAESTPIQLLVKTTTWTGTWSAGAPDSSTTVIFAANYTSTGNLAACAAIVNSGNVVFNPGHTLTLQNTITVNGGSVTFEDTASLLQISDAANSGFINYKRTTTPIRRYDYTYWSSPVDFQILANLSPLTLSDKYFWWNPAIYNWANITAPGISPMEVGKGYIIRGPQTYDITTPANYTGTFTGTPNNGEYPVAITVAGANNLTLIGNPYPSAVDADLFMSDPENAASIGTGTTLYFWTHNTPMATLQYTFSDYATYNFTGGTGTAAAAGANNAIPNGNIASGQGFFVKGIASGTAKFKNSMRIAGNNNQFYRTASTEKSRFWLELSNDFNAFKQILIGYVDGASNDFDNAYDAPIANGTNPVQLYSLLDGGKMSIQGRGTPFQLNDIIPLGFSVTTAGQYTITMSQSDGLFDSQEVFLKDNMSGTFHNLTASAYVFDALAGADDHRFEIYYVSPEMLSNPDQQTIEKAVVYHNNGNLFVTDASRNIAQAQLFDMAGRLLATRTNEAAAETLYFGNEFPNQPLVVKITYTNGIVQSVKAAY